MNIYLMTTTSSFRKFRFFNLRKGTNISMLHTIPIIWSLLVSLQ